MKWKTSNFKEIISLKYGIQQLNTCLIVSNNIKNFNNYLFIYLHYYFIKKKLNKKLIIPLSNKTNQIRNTFSTLLNTISTNKV